MKNINRDFKFRDRRRPKLSSSERGLVLAIMISGGFTLTIVGFIWWLLW